MSNHRHTCGFCRQAAIGWIWVPVEGEPAPKAAYACGNCGKGKLNPLETRPRIPACVQPAFVQGILAGYR